jgi:hypothetical protein
VQASPIGFQLKEGQAIKKYQPSRGDIVFLLVLALFA